MPRAIDAQLTSTVIAFSTNFIGSKGYSKEIGINSFVDLFCIQKKFKYKLNYFEPVFPFEIFQGSLGNNQDYLQPFLLFFDFL